MTTLPVLSEQAAAEFDRYLKAAEQCKRLGKYSKQKSDAKQAVLDAMGDHTRCRLPDGRVIQATAKSRKMPAKPAHEQSWWELFEAEE